MSAGVREHGAELAHLQRMARLTPPLCKSCKRQVSSYKRRVIAKFAKR
jgi:hypothetical protein